MATNRITKVKTTSWFSRIGNSVAGIIFGVVLFFVAFPILFLNEGRAVKTSRALDEGADAVVAVVSEQVNAGNEGRLVHINGFAVTDEMLVDPEFGVEVNAIRLERHVEMYQWQERRSTNTEKKVGGSERTETTYTYDTGWSGTLINSENFELHQGHQNPAAMPFEDQAVVADKVTIGAFTLSPNLIENFHEAEAVVVEAAPPNFRASHLFQDTVYIGNDPQNPQVGDVRVTFTAVFPMDVTVMAQQSGSSFVPYTASNGRSISMLRSGLHTPEAMFEAAQANNTTLTWILRFVGTAALFFGLMMILRPLSVIADVLPVLGTATGFLLGIIALLVALPLSFITIAIAWLVYRPLLAVGLILLGGVLFWGATYVGKRFGKQPVLVEVPA